MPKRKAPVRNDVEEDEITESSDSGEESGDDGSTSSDGDDFPSEDEIEAEDDEDNLDNIDVDFEFFDPTENDFHGLKNLLVGYLDGRQFASSELVEAIVAASASTVIKSDEDPLGVGAIIPLHDTSSSSSGKNQYIKDIQSVLKEQCRDDKLSKKLDSFWGNTKNALLVSERLINCPPQLAAPLMESLKNESSAKPPHSILYLGRVYVDPTDKDEKDAYYATPEGEFLAKHSSWKYTFPAANKPAVKDELVPRRIVAVIEYKKLDAVIKDIKKVVGG